MYDYYAFVENTDYLESNRPHMLSDSCGEACIYLRKQGIGHIGLPKDMSHQVYQMARKTVSKKGKWFYIYIQELFEFLESLPARQVKSLLLQEPCDAIRFKPAVQELLNFMGYYNISEETNSLRLIVWIQPAAEKSYMHPTMSYSMSLQQAVHRTKNIT